MKKGTNGMGARDMKGSRIERHQCNQYERGLLDHLLLCRLYTTRGGISMTQIDPLGPGYDHKKKVKIKMLMDPHTSLIHPASSREGDHLADLLLDSLVENTLDMDAFSAAITKIYEAACKLDTDSINSVCECFCGHGSKLIIRVLVDKGVEKDLKVLIISCIRQCALIERLQMDLLRAGLVDALITVLSGSELSSEDQHRSSN